MQHDNLTVTAPPWEATLASCARDGRPAAVRSEVEKTAGPCLFKA